MSNLSLYHITQEQFRIYELLEELGGEFTPEIEEALAINHENFVVKSEGYIEGIAKYRDMKELAKAKAKEYMRIAKTCENIEEGLKGRLQHAMVVMGHDKVDVGLRKLSLRSSTAVNITDETAIPAEYIIVETKVDKMKIKEALKNGVVIDGAELVTNKSIQIR